MPKCTVCNHSQSPEINLALLAGATLDHLKQQFGLGRSALHRHKQHLRRTIDKSEDRLANNLLLGYLFQLNDYNAAAAATVAAARAEGNHRLTLQAANAGARIINAMARFEVDLDRETAYRLITSPDYVQSGCLLPGDPRVLTGPRQTLARSLAAACPETALGDLFDPEDVAAYLKLAQEPDSNTSLPQSRQLELPGFLLPLDGILPSAAASNSSPGAQQPEPKWDPNGTKAGQIPPLSEIIEEIQIDMQVEQISGTDLAAGPAPNPPPSAQAPPAVRYSKVSLDFPPPPTENRKPPTVSDEPREPLDETRAAALAEYLANFAPYANSAPGPDLCPPNPLETQNPELETALPKPKPPPPYDATAARADELFMMAHGYPRNNPPKPIPYRRREEDFKSNSVFADLKGTFC